MGTTSFSCHATRKRSKRKAPNTRLIHAQPFPLTVALKRHPAAQSSIARPWALDPVGNSCSWDGCEGGLKRHGLATHRLETGYRPALARRDSKRSRPVQAQRNRLAWGARSAVLDRAYPQKEKHRNPELDSGSIGARRERARITPKPHTDSNTTEPARSIAFGQIPSRYPAIQRRR